ncbi:anaphase-promoting complex subunit 4 [Oratosquilla oratoria]|uniref:anaphase-promoting complex subunit 4 n=1 Tax=Oratosquilla oratoria TaxID=337810 RepID=UPI003F7726C2
MSTMAATCVMKQVEERHVAVEITKCVWSPRMDLVAIANVQGQVALHRLSWQRVWIISPPGEEVKVMGITWRPDSKVLAIAYSSGDIILVDIEDSTPVHKLEMKCNITSLSWSQHVPASQEASSSQPEFEDVSGIYLPKLPPLAKTYTGATERNEESTEDNRLLRDQNILNMLVIGTAAGRIDLYAFGLFHCGWIDITTHLPYASEILDAVMSHDLNMISAVVSSGQGENKEIVCVTVETVLLAYRHKELLRLAYKYGQIYNLMTYTNHTLQLITEAWESILLEMDHKLASYAGNVKGGGVSADFLDLLVFGITTPEFDIFISNKLTEKGIKKLNHSIELSYSNIRKLVLKHVQTVGQALVYHLGQVVGLARRTDRFGMLGVEEHLVTAAVREAGAFVMKAIELQQVTDASMNNFRAFLRWLYLVVVRKMGEQIPAEMSKTTQQDVTYITEFLHDSLEECQVGPDGEVRSRFKLEKVGQYLKDENLTYPSDNDQNPWVKFLAEHPNLQNHELIFPHHHEKSLVQEHKNLAKVLNQMAAHPAEVISQALQVHSVVPLMKIEEGVSFKISQMSCPRENKVFSVVLPMVPSGQPVMYLSQWSTNSQDLVGETKKIPGPQQQISVSPFIFSTLDVGLSRSHDASRRSSFSLMEVSPPMHILDVQFYTDETLSLLMCEPSDISAQQQSMTPQPQTAYFVQLSVGAASAELSPLTVYGGRCVADLDIPCLDATNLVDPNGYRRLEHCSAVQLAVSGSRKVALVLFESRKRVRLFEMEVDEDEDDEDEDETQRESIINVSGVSEEMNETL